MSILGVDIGTSGAKAIAFDHNGNLLSKADSSYNTIMVQDGWFELDPEIIMNAVCEIIGKVVKDVDKNNPVEIICVSCLGSVMIPVDDRDRVLYNGMSFFDSRTVNDIETVCGMDKFELYQITGTPLNPYYTLNKILWLKQNKFNLFKKTKKLYGLKELLFKKLGVEPKTDHCSASITMLYDLKEKNWFRKLLNNIDVDFDLFPEVTDSCEIIGEASGSILKEFGLKKGVKVIAGGADTGLCALGAGVNSKGKAANTIGTFEEISVCLENIFPDESKMKCGISFHLHVLPDLFLCVGLPTTGGFVLKWFRDQFCEIENKNASQNNISTYQVLLDSVRNIKTNIIFLPHLNGGGSPNVDPLSRGAFINISVGTTKLEFIKALVEGLNFEAKLMVDYLQENILNIKSLFVNGGAAKSDVWMQIKSDILKMDIVSLKETETGCLGASILGAIASNYYSSIDEACHNMLKADRIYKPDDKSIQYYSEKYRNYKRIYPYLNKMLFS